MTSLRPTSVCDTTPLQRFESQSSSSEEPSSPTAASIIAAAAAASTSQHDHHLHQHHQDQQHNNNNLINNNVKVDLQLPPFVGVTKGLGGSGGNVEQVAKARTRGTSHIFRRIALDLSLLSCVGLIMLVLTLWCEPYKRGFFCNDLSLKHPYRESTVPSWMLVLMCAALPVSTILLVEFYRAQFEPRYALGQCRTQQMRSGYFLCHMELPEWAVECYRKIGAFAIGLGVEQLTTDVAKYVIGRLRPHFFALCQPIMLDGTTCSDAINADRYIDDFTCASATMNPKRIKDMHLSFPSGHASFASFAMVYLVIYLQRRMHWSRLRMLRHLLQFLLLMFAWYTALTRVSDYKHHSSDVLAGGAIGVVFAVVVTSTIW